MKHLAKKWAWFIAIWVGSVLTLTIFAYLLRFFIN